MKYLLKKTISLVCIAAIAFAFILPRIYFNWRDKQAIAHSYPIDSIDFHLDSNAKNIKQVRNILKLYDQYASYANSPENYAGSGENTLCILNELIGTDDAWNQNKDKQLQGPFVDDETPSLKKVYAYLEELKKIEIVSADTMKWIQNCQVIQYIQNDIYLYVQWKQGDSYLWLLIDTDTEKVLKIVDATGISKEKATKEELLNYADYLRLNIINDWSYNGTILSSTNAGLKIAFIGNGTERQYIILPMEIPLI